MSTTPYDTDPYDTDEDWDENGELALSDSDERLPWLESDDDEEAATGFDTARLLLMGALALVLLAAVVGGIWFASRFGAGAEPEADGSVIAAPDGPYKTRPEDEGGKTFPGTGDTSFAVGEGQTREGQLASAPAVTPPKEAAAPTIPSTVDEEPRAAQPTGPSVQVGAFPRREDAEAGWASLIRQTEALSGVSHRVVEGQADIGRVFRLQALPGDRAASRRLCAALKADGIACFVK
ncbi:SPOR domain-containing protein [Qipengyuania marisflavi]|uniref:SPOR domain-containing protein n=1 Tax=Qipengyuania marisflavi TaxID=2486356 RepID=A0A5S3P6B8_9SPHN|nr:SPOR domain-containing protein [Qipengyuania marisflavi]TMM48768.1 SPOR domain-containing protein [Qipengyuania marisflavi]